MRNKNAFLAGLWERRGGLVEEKDGLQIVLRLFEEIWAKIFCLFCALCR